MLFHQLEGLGDGRTASGDGLFSAKVAAGDESGLLVRTNHEIVGEPERQRTAVTVYNKRRTILDIIRTLKMR